MNKKVNKIYSARIHKESLAQKLENKKVMNSIVLKDSKNLDSIEKAIECIDELNNLIISHKIQLREITSDSKLKDLKL